MPGLFGRLTTVVLILAIGGLLTWVAIPRFFAGLYTAAHASTLERLSAGQDVSPSSLAMAAQGQKAALVWLASGDLWTSLGAIRLAQAKASKRGSTEWADYLDACILAERSGLALEPAQPYAWTQLTHALLLKNGPSAEIVPYLRMAIETGPFEPKLVLTRVGIALAEWDFLEGEDKALVDEQIKRAAQYYPDRLARVAKRSYGLRKVRGVLENDPLLLKAFTAKYLKQ